MEEAWDGCMRSATRSEVVCEYGGEVCVAALGAIEKGDSSFRVIHDATHGVKVNPQIIQCDQVPGGQRT